MTDPAVIRLTLDLPDGMTVGDLITRLQRLGPDHRLIGRHVLEILDADSPAIAESDPVSTLTAADRLDRARTAPDRGAAARILTKGEDIPPRQDLAALLRAADWPCSTDTARDLRAELLAERMAGGGPALTAGTGE